MILFFLNSLYNLFFMARYPRAIQRRIDELRIYQGYSQREEAHRQRVADSHLGHMDRVHLTQDAYRHYQRTGDYSQIQDLINRGIWMEGVPL